MKILILADIHGDMEMLKKILGKVENEAFDLVICPGDFTDMFNKPKELDQLDLAEMIIQKLLALRKPILCVPGNHDPYEILDLFEEYDVNLHKKHKKINGIEFIGFGGAATPFNTIFEPTEGEIKEGLAKIGTNLKVFVLVVHNPPKNTKLDKVESGEHVGSKAVKDFITKAQPLLAISAHIHESEGTEKIGDTTLFYPGSVYEGKYGIATIEGKTVKCEMKKV